MLQRAFYGFLILSFVLPLTAQAQVVAIVGNKKITLDYFQKKYDEVKHEAINPPTPELFLEDLIRFEIGVQEAQKQKLQEDPIVKERFRQEIYKALVEKAIGEKVQKIKVTEREMRTYYKKYPELRTSHILIEYRPDASDAEKAEALKRANEIYTEVKKSKRPFEELVKLYSDDTLSKNNGGDIGYQSRITLVPTYYDAALKLKDGELTGVIPSRYGYHIIKMTGKRAYDQANKRQLRATVFDEKRKDIFDSYFKTLKKSYTIKKNSKLIQNVK